MSEKMKNCKHCGNSIATSAKVCPQCGGKNPKPIYKRVWFIILMVIIVLGVIGSMLGGEDNDGGTPTDVADTTKPQEEVVIEYTAYDVDTLIDDLNENALAAKEKYNKQYVELTGELGVIDSDGKYFSLRPLNDAWALKSVLCRIKNDTQKQQLMEMSNKAKVVLKGKITDVGEIAGYTLSIDEIVSY